MYNILGDYIRRKRNSKNMSLRQFGNLCDLSHTHIDSIEKGTDFRTGKKVRLTSDTLQKIANALNINNEILFALSLEQTAEKFEFYYDYIEREDIKDLVRSKINDSSICLSHQIEFAILLFKAYFSRSLEMCKFNIEHVNFETYVSMLLNQSNWKTAFSKKIYDGLVEVYGTLDGIPDGQTYFQITNWSKSPELILYNPNEKQLIQDYRSLSNQGKEYILQTMDMAIKTYKKQTIFPKESLYSIAAWGGDETETTQPPIDETTT